jgi:hypothetical protein
VENQGGTEVRIQLTPELVLASTPSFTSTPILKPEFTVTPAEVTSVPTPLNVLPTNTPREVYKPINLEFRITYVIYEEDTNNKIVGSKLFVLDPPYENPQLIFSSEGNDQTNVLFSQFPWSNNYQKLVFSEQTKSGSKLASIYDRSTGEITPLITSIEEDYHIILNKFNWSIDNRRFYIPVYEGFAIRSQIIDIISGEINALDYLTQDELLAWSFTNPDQFVLITRPNFPETGGETISVREIGITEPLISIRDFQNYLLLSDNFSLSPNGELAVIGAISQNGTPVDLLLNFKTGEWKVVLQNQDIPVTKYWSPNNKWIVFNRFNNGLFLLDIEKPGRLIQISSSDSAIPISWLSDSSMLIFQDGSGVYGVFPEKPENTFLIQDFSSILQGIAPFFQIDLITSGS